MFDLAVRDKIVLAATDGGLLRFDGRRWAPEPGPAGLRSIVSLNPLTVSMADGRRITLERGANHAFTPILRRRDLDDGEEIDLGDTWLQTHPELLKLFPQPPPAHVYSPLRVGRQLLAGTSLGIYRGQDGKWAREPIPSSLPLSRPNGIAEIGGAYVVGGLGGLFIGAPGRWRSVCTDSIRQVVRVGTDVWVVHGNGALDKLEPATGRLFPDVLSGGAKRPWTSCVGEADGRLLFGGLGGWSEKSSQLSERYPHELDGDVTLCLTGVGGTRWIGTQRTGLVRFDSKGIRIWNPGNGLHDTWVTALCIAHSALKVGTAHAGLFRVVGQNMTAVPCPSKRITQLSLWRGD